MPAQMMDGGMMDGMMGGAFMWFWALFAVVVLALLVVGVVWLVRTLAGTGSATGTARQELDLRYARGELTREEYQQRRADLEGGA